MDTIHVPDPCPSTFGALSLSSRLVFAGAELTPKVVPVDSGYLIDFKPGWFTSETPARVATCRAAVRAVCGAVSAPETNAVATPTLTAAVQPAFTLPPWNPGFFSTVIDRDPQIAAAWDVVCSNVARDFRDPSHLLFVGEPACGKSLIVAGFERLLGPAAWRVDLSETTPRGFPRLLMQKAESGAFPRFLLLEEVDKAKPAVLQCLLPLLDARQLCQHMRVERGRAIEQSVKVECMLLGTANSAKSLGKKLEGAVLSRCCCLNVGRPDREIMTRILLDFAAANGHDPAIVPPVVEFMFGKLKSSDPRTAKTLMSSGSGWLDGSAAKKWRNVYGI